jgi:hypothetical protein
MTEEKTDYTLSSPIHPMADEPETLVDLKDRVAELEYELERAYEMGDSVCDLMVAALERRELQLLRREHEAIRESLEDADYRVHCPVCFGMPDLDGEIQHADTCPFAAVERFQERHG